MYSGCSESLLVVKVIRATVWGKKLSPAGTRTPTGLSDVL